ncbi:AI-2E family transporter [Clostridioides difficile]|nr:AI-2E family transporter [Clostridioides difficile]
MEDNKGLARDSSKYKIVSISVVVIILITFWYMLNMVLLTFIMTFIFYNLLVATRKRIKKFSSLNIPDSLIIIVLYALFAILLVLISYAVVPIIIVQLTELSRVFSDFDVNQFAQSLGPKLYPIVSKLDFNKYISQAGLLIASTATKVGSFGVNILLAFLLSLLLLLEKNEIKNFGDKLSNSKISFIYNSLVFFGKSFVKNFGEVMKVQVMIAFINSVVSMIFLGFMGFPQIWALGFMIFVLGLIPVAGVIVSLIPLTVIAFNTGGITKVFGVLLMICIVHAVETYILNPKLMSNRTKLPVCFVFIILLVGEHYLGVWGLLIGVPIFMFLMDILGVKFTSR